MLSVLSPVDILVEVHWSFTLIFSSHEWSKWPLKPFELPLDHISRCSRRAQHFTPSPITFNTLKAFFQISSIPRSSKTAIVPDWFYKNLYLGLYTKYFHGNLKRISKCLTTDSSCIMQMHFEYSGYYVPWISSSVYLPRR